MKWIEVLKKYHIFTIIMLILLGCFSFMAARNTAIFNAPDEGLRLKLAGYIYNTGRLPIGNEEEIISPEWGFSYAYTPYLPQIIAGFLMRFVGLFNKSNDAVFIALRMVNVIAYVIAGLYACRIAGLLKDRYKYSYWLFPVIVMLLPQLCFISSYHNNDMFSVMSCIMILYYIMRGHKNAWDNKCCIGLGVSMAICALSYYFAYMWIVFAAIYAVIDCRMHEKQFENVEKYFTVKKGFLASGTAVILAGWYFIRNAIIYNGDMLGMKAMGRQAKLYEAAGHERYEPINLYEANMSWGEWFEYTFKSFVGTFSYMTVYMSDRVYNIYAGILLVGAAAAAVYLIRRFISGNDRFKGIDIIFGIGMMAAFVFPICFSMYRSATKDLQYQGRYVMSGLPVLAYIMVMGYDVISGKLAKRVSWLRLDIIAGVIWTVLFMHAFFEYIIKMNLIW